SRWYDHLYHDHAARVPGVDAVSQLAAHTYEISSATFRSLSDFFVNRGNVHAICPWPVTRQRRLSDAWDRLGTRAVRRYDESHTRRTASSETCDGSLPRNRLARGHRHTSTRPGNSVVGSPLFDCRWYRLHGRHFIFRERAAALWPFRLASVRACRHQLSLCGGVYLRNLKSSSYSWTSLSARWINCYAAG